MGSTKNFNEMETVDKDYAGCAQPLSSIVSE